MGRIISGQVSQDLFKYSQSIRSKDDHTTWKAKYRLFGRNVCAGKILCNETTFNWMYRQCLSQDIKIQIHKAKVQFTWNIISVKSHSLISFFNLSVKLFVSDIYGFWLKRFFLKFESHYAVFLCVILF